jgi:uncharacterized membrane protein
MRETLLFIHFIGLGLGLGTSFAFMRLGLAAKNLPLAERAPFALKSMALSKNGSIGLALLILSGIGLIFTNGPAATFAMGGGYFHAKLGLVVVLSGLLGFMQALQARIRREQGGPALAKLAKLGPIGLLLTLAIVLLAVLAFH